jgi:hypothetical protein
MQWLAAGRRSRHVALAAALGTLLAGCATSGPASVAGGECRLFRPPAHVVRGADQESQNWADDTVEAGVAGCHWHRPAKARASGT